ncbi:hypothetical protein DY000_02016696 [Brassica cretica]|uniref:Uncharacterized protein n=1 Tax=Brassica cretica TaxID=69181 RepID=A0ABQ7CP59_BRACR|nr:hypothetical protein DY000_02016696 [Brassica cretica]
MDLQGWNPGDFRKANWWEDSHYEDFGKGWEQKESRIERRDLMDPRGNRWKNGRSTLGRYGGSGKSPTGISLLDLPSCISLTRDFCVICRSVDILAWLPTLTKILRLVSLNQVQSPSYCVDITHRICYQGSYGLSLSKIGYRGSRPLQDHNGSDGFKYKVMEVRYFLLISYRAVGLFVRKGTHMSEEQSVYLFFCSIGGGDRKWKIMIRMVFYVNVSGLVFTCLRVGMRRGKETQGSADGLIKTSQGMQLADRFWLNADCVLVRSYGKF